MSRNIKPSLRLHFFTRFRNIELSLPSTSPAFIASAPSARPRRSRRPAGGTPRRTDNRSITSAARLQTDEGPSRPFSLGTDLSAASNSSKEVDSTGFRRRRVVSSFICHGTPYTADFRVSTFKRSDKVRTYPGKWAGCSGSVESSDVSPVRAALRELLEETGLRERQLVRIGGGGGPVDEDGEEGFGEGGVRYELRDAYMRTIWEVWPFLWRVLTDEGKHEMDLDEIKAKICLDWEHDEMQFVTLDEMKRMDTVEDLGRGVRTVLASLDK